MDDTSTTTARPGAAVLAVAAACTAAAGAIHFAMVPTHGGEDPALAIGFAIAGWAQLAAAVALLLRPGRPVYLATALVNAGCVATWAVSRTSGLPFGSHAGVAEAAGFVDIASVVLEGLAIVLAMALLVRPALGATWGQASWVMASLPVLAVVAVTTAAIVSPSATDHGGAGHDHGAEGGEHDHGDVAWQPLDYATQRQLTDELALARAATEKYPTVADLKAGGGRRLGVFTPGNGAHHTMPVEGVPIPEKGFDLQAIMGNVAGFDPANPPIILYSGTEDTAVPVGVMYVVFQDEEPEGFAGPNDIWHRHTGVCAVVGADGGVDVLLPIASDTTKEQCDEVGGNHMPVTPWMVHVWTAPGWESTDGVFSHENPLLVCRDETTGDVATDFARGCQGLA